MQGQVETARPVGPAPALMVIDDDDQLREALALVLESHGYNVDCCAGAVEALARLQTAAAPSLILLDLWMPDMDGWQFRLAQKSVPKWASIPVIAISADRSPKAAAIDVDAHLTKPVSDDALLETVGQLLETAGSARVRALRSRRRRARVLIVHAEERVCDLLCTLLSTHHDVASFTCPRAALASMLQGAFDVVLSGLIMPELTGMTIYERLASGRPELAQRTVFIAEGRLSPAAQSFLATTRRSQVRAPFRREQLLDVIEAQLTLPHCGVRA